VLIYLTS